MSYQVINPFIQFVDPINGKPLSGGSLYFGRQDTDPKNQPANRINVYAAQDNGTEVLLAQPITLNGAGQPQYSGSVKQLKVETYAGESAYCVQVFNKSGSQKGYSARVYSLLDIESLASTTSNVLIAGIKAKLFRQFLIVEPPTGDAGAFFNSIIAQGIENIFCSEGVYTFNTSMSVDSVRLNILGAGRGVVTFKRGSTLGTANIITGQLHDLEISEVGFDNGKGTYTPSLANFQLENAVNSSSPISLKIVKCSFSNLVNLGIVINGSLADEAKNINVSECLCSNGTRGFVMVRRYGKNVTIMNNYIENSVDVANTLFKPIEVSGTIDAWICDNVITQTNNAGGPLIVEYIDRESVNIHIERNSYYGPAGEAYYKVGASSNVWFQDNHASGTADIGAYFEGCENLWVCRNRLANTRRNSLVLAQDFDTSRFNRKVKILDNHFVDANIANATAGVPYTSLGSTNSYHVWIQDGTEQVELRGNHYIKGTNTAGGVLISSPSYTIMNEDFSLLDATAVTIHNTFSPVGAKYKILDNISCQTTAAGEATISGAPSTIVNPPIVAHFAPNALVTLKTALSGTAAYVVAEPDTAPNFAVTCKNSAHANVTPSSAVTVYWRADCSTVVKAIMGKTA